MKLILFTMAFIIATFNLAQPQNLTSLSPADRCTIGHNQPAIGFWTWPAASQVNVYLREPDFSSHDAEAVERAIQNWNAMAGENGSHVHFVLRGMSQAARTSLGDMMLVRGDVFTSKEKHLALLEAHSWRHDQLIDYARVIVDYRVNNPEVLTNVMAHELGHSLGLMDCYKCANRTTAMGLMKSANETNGIDGPTACDTLAVRIAYRELSARLKTEPAMTRSETPDEGEEPEADDTPVIKPPRTPLPFSKNLIR
jgi:hypothetical protein